MKLKKIIVSIVKRNVFLRKIAYKTKLFIDKTNYMKYYRKNDVDSKLCVFEAFNGKKYCDSPKAIYLRMLNDKKYEDYKFVWAFINPKEFKYLEENRNTKVVKYDSKEYKEVYSKAKYWFAPSKIPNYIVPKSDQVYVQFWHGTPLKKLGFDVIVKGENKLNSNIELANKYLFDAKRYTYMVSPSKFTSSKYISAFGLKKIGKESCVIETGYPRNDALFKYDSNTIKSIKEKLNIKSDKKIILYAPTWRDNQHKIGVGYTYDLNIDFDKFKERFSDEYIVLFRTHYLVAESIDLSKYKNFIYNVSDYSDINDLYLISDIIITDYSSVFFDYANLKRPMLFYMYDLDEYKGKMRDFYIDLDTIPGPIVMNEEDLYNEIDKIDSYFDRYGKKYKEFNKKYNYLDDENSSKRVLDIVIEEEK